MLNPKALAWGQACPQKWCPVGALPDVRQTQPLGQISLPVTNFRATKKFLNMHTKRIDGVTLQWPAVTLAFPGRKYILENELYEDDDIRIQVSLKKKEGVWVKHLDVTAKHPMPTPDYVETDRQRVPDPGMRLCGYVNAQKRKDTSNPEEEGAGEIPGCGYPLIGDKIFVGLVHQAGFAVIEKQDEASTTYSLRHHPVWNGNRLKTLDSVFCVSGDPKRSFSDYIDHIRAPIELKPFFAFCSFWSDPYLGNYEYAVTGEAMQRFIAAYKKLKIKPDVFTFDAGWQKRKSFFEPKPGLEFEHYPHLSLWISHNGPMGISPEFLKQQKIAVGEGYSSAYSGKDYGVLLDPALEKALTKRFCELAQHCQHFKIDWDNDCATAPEFAEKYPTRNHVREASLNVMNRIMAAVRAVNPNIIVRNGWWPSPWWLLHVQHVFLSQSGDSEYASLPTRHQRASAATHRDLMYYNHLLRDHTMIPLSSFDNHEFPNSIRNAFADTDGTRADNTMLCLLRGSTYFSWTIQPESLTPYQADVMKQAIAFARTHAKHLFVRAGRMFGGNPGLGEIYGFLQPGDKESWCVLRNPAPMPQAYTLPDDFKCATQFYPDFRKLERDFVMLPEEVKVLILTKKPLKLPHDIPFQVFQNQDNGKFDYYFPASRTVSKKIQPMVAELHQIKELLIEKIAWNASGRNLFFTLTAPYRMNDLRLCIKLTEKTERNTTLKIYESRYYGELQSSSYALPVTELPPGKSGYGEIYNPATLFQKRERYFSAPVPAGGQTAFHLAFDDSLAPEQLEIWAVGFETRSAECTQRNTAPLDFAKALPLQHPYGFPRAIRCV